MRLFIRSPFFLITSSLFFILYFVTSVAAAPERHELAPPGTPERNPDGSRDETLRRVGEQINTKYPPGLYKLHIDGMRPPNEEGYAGIACDSRQDQALFKPTRMTEGGGKDFYSWDSGSCIDQLNGKPCCQNIDLAGYRIEPGDPRYVIQDFQREQCKNLDNLPPSMRDRPEIKQVCDLIAQESSTPPPGNPTQPTGPGDSPAQAELARATAARQAAEQQLNNAQTALASAAAAQQAAEQQLATAQVTLASATEALQAAEQVAKQAAEQQAAKRAIAERAVQDAEQQLTSVNMELETANNSLQLLEQQRSNAQEKVASLKARRDDALRILNDARAKVAQLTGMEFVGDIHDSTAPR